MQSALLWTVIFILLSSCASRPSQSPSSQSRPSFKSVNYQWRQLYFQALEAEKSGDFARAASDLQKLVNNQIIDDAIMMRLTFNLVRIGEIEKATGVLQSWLAQGETQMRSPAALVYGSLLLSLDQSEKAENFFWQEIRTTSVGQIKDVCLKLTQLYRQKDNEEKLKEVIALCSQRDRKNQLNYQWEFATWLFQNQKYSQAEKVLSSIYDSEPQKHSAALVLMAEIWQLTDRKDLILGAYEKHYQKFTKDLKIAGKLADLYLANQDYQKAVPVMEQIADYGPYDMQLLFRLSGLYIQLANYSAAIEVLNRLLEKNHQHHDRIHWTLATVYQQRNDSTSALRHLQAIEPESEFYLHAQEQMVKTYLKLAVSDPKWEKFAEQSIASLTKEPHLFFSAQLNLALYYYEQKNEVDDAIVALEKIEKSELFTLNHRLFLASLYDQNQDYQKFDALMKPALKADPHNPEVLNLIGYSHLEREDGDLILAGRYLALAYSLSPESAHIQDSWGWYLYKKGKLSEALALLEQANQALPQDAVVSLHLAQVLQDLSKTSRAKSVLQKSLTTVQSSYDQQRILDQLQKIEKRQPANR